MAQDDRARVESALYVRQEQCRIWSIPNRDRDRRGRFKHALNVQEQSRAAAEGSCERLGAGI